MEAFEGSIGVMLFRNFIVPVEHIDDVLVVLYGVGVAADGYHEAVVGRSGRGD